MIFSQRLKVHAFCASDITLHCISTTSNLKLVLIVTEIVRELSVLIARLQVRPTGTVWRYFWFCDLLPRLWATNRSKSFPNTTVNIFLFQIILIYFQNLHQITISSCWTQFFSIFLASNAYITNLSGVIIYLICPSVQWTHYYERALKERMFNYVSYLSSISIPALFAWNHLG